MGVKQSMKETGQEDIQCELASEQVTRNRRADPEGFQAFLMKHVVHNPNNPVN